MAQQLCTPLARGGVCGVAGTCAADGQTCACDAGAGWSWDVSVVVVPTCVTPAVLFPVAYGVVGLSALIVAVAAAVTVVRLKRAVPLRGVLALTVAGELSTAAQMLAHYLEVLHGPATTVFLLITLNCLVLTLSYLFWLLLRPMAQFAGKAEQALKWTLVANCAFMSLATLIPWIVAQAALARKDYSTFSTTSTLSILGVFVFAVVFAVSAAKVVGKLIVALDVDLDVDAAASASPTTPPSRKQQQQQQPSSTAAGGNAGGTGTASSVDTGDLAVSPVPPRPLSLMAAHQRGSSFVGIANATTHEHLAKRKRFLATAKQLRFFVVGLCAVVATTCGLIVALFFASAGETTFVYMHVVWWWLLVSGFPAIGGVVVWFANRRSTPAQSSKAVSVRNLMAAAGGSPANRSKSKSKSGESNA